MLLDIEKIKTSEEMERYGGSVSGMIEAGSAIQIKDDESASQAVTFLGGIKSFLKEADEKRKDLTKGAKEFIDTVNGIFKPWETKLKEVDHGLRNRLSLYQLAKEVAEIRAREEAEKKLQKQLDKAEKTGVMPTKLVEVPVEQPKTFSGDGAAASFRTIREFEIEDQEKIPAEYWMLDEVKIGKIIRAGGTILGVKVIEKKVPSIR